MAAIKDPTKLTFQAPTTRTDGSALGNTKLNYELGVRKASETALKPLMAIVGTLQGANYEAPLALSSLEKGVSHFVALRAIDPRDAANPTDDLYSVWSPEIEILFSVAAPAAPTNFTVS